MSSFQSLGGIARGITQRKEALNKYYLSPNICLSCNKTIIVLDNQKVADARNKKFCSRSCSATFNNPKRIRIKKIKIKPEKIKRIRLETISLVSKGDLFKNRKNWQSARSTIRKNAAVVYKKSNRDLKCSKCGYDLYVEIAHIKPVSQFSDDSLIRDINNIDNLIALCPNHHWEFDNNIAR